MNMHTPSWNTKYTQINGASPRSSFPFHLNVEFFYQIQKMNSSREAKGRNQLLRNVSSKSTTFSCTILCNAWQCYYICGLLRDFDSIYHTFILVWYLINAINLLPCYFPNYVLPVDICIIDHWVVILSSSFISWPVTHSLKTKCKFLFCY
jgi:hypothetical protein